MAALPGPSVGWPCWLSAARSGSVWPEVCMATQQRGHATQSGRLLGRKAAQVSRGNEMPLVQPHKDGTVLAVKVVPGSSRDRIVGLLGERLKVAVRQPPEKGRANEAVGELVAGALGLRPKDVAVVRGETRPEKDLLVAGLRPEEVMARLGLGDVSPGGLRDPRK